MDKASRGEDDSQEWARLKAARKEIDGLAEEKLMIVSKVFNLTQRFVQELDESIDETEHLINKQQANTSSRSQEVQACLAAAQSNRGAAMSLGGAKEDGFDDLDFDMGSGYDLDRFPKRNKSQHRGADGKFESKGMRGDDLDMEGLGGGPFGNIKHSNKSAKMNKFMDMGGRRGIDPFEGLSKKKSRGRPTGTGGHVANVFYDSQLPGSQDHMGLSASMDGDALGDGLADSEALDDRDGEIYGIGDNMNDVGNDDLLSPQESDKELCAKCGSSSYIPTPGPTPVEDPNVLWIECGKCFKWYHAPCMGIDASTFDANKEWYCCQLNGGE